MPDWVEPLATALAAAVALAAVVVAALARHDSKRAAGASERSAVFSEDSANAAAASAAVAQPEEARRLERTDVAWELVVLRSASPGEVELRNVGSTPAYAVTAVLAINGKRVNLSLDTVDPSDSITYDASSLGERHVVAGSMFSEAARLTGIEIDVLRRLAQDNVLPGVHRSKRGHAYIDPDLLPTFQALVALVTTRRTLAIAAVESALKRVDQELEAIRGDLSFAREDPMLPLGDDLLGSRTSGRDNESTLRSALSRFDSAVFALREYDDAWKSTQQVAPRHTP